VLLQQLGQDFILEPQLLLQGSALAVLDGFDGLTAFAIGRESSDPVLEEFPLPAVEQVRTSTPAIACSAKPFVYLGSHTCGTHFFFTFPLTFIFSLLNCHRYPISSWIVDKLADWCLVFGACNNGNARLLHRQPRAVSGLGLDKRRGVGMSSPGRTFSR
jgi:hypothetical protein